MARSTGLCGECGERPAEPGQYKCRVCHARYMREWRAKAVTIRLDDDRYERMRQRSGRTRQSFTEIVSEALDLLFAADGPAA